VNEKRQGSKEKLERKGQNERGGKGICADQSM
jgi:hypothetical protein